MFSIEMLMHRYSEDPATALEKAIGKTDGFIFLDNISMEIINCWLDGKHDEAREKLKEHVSRISSQIS